MRVGRPSQHIQTWSPISLKSIHSAAQNANPDHLRYERPRISWWMHICTVSRCKDHVAASDGLPQ